MEITEIKLEQELEELKEEYKGKGVAAMLALLILKWADLRDKTKE